MDNKGLVHTFFCRQNTMDNPLEPRNAGNKSNDDSELTEINE